MPFLPAGLIGLITAAAGTAGSLYNLANQPSGPKPPTPAQITNNAVAAETLNRKNATTEASQLLPGLQANTSGGLSPDAYQQLSANFSGNANLAQSPQMQQLIARFLGLDTGSSFGGSTTFGSSGAPNPSSPGLVNG